MMDERKVLATPDSRSPVEKAAAAAAAVATRAMKKGGPVVPVGSTVALRRRNSGRTISVPWWCPGSCSTVARGADY